MRRVALRSRLTRQAGGLDEAEKLKQLVQRARDQRRTGRAAGGQTPDSARPPARRGGLVENAYPKLTLASMILSDDVRILGCPARSGFDRHLAPEKTNAPKNRLTSSEPPRAAVLNHTDAT